MFRSFLTYYYLHFTQYCAFVRQRYQNFKIVINVNPWNCIPIVCRVDTTIFVTKIDFDY